MKSQNVMTIVFLFLTTLILTPLTSNYVAASQYTGTDNPNNKYSKLNQMSGIDETISSMGNQIPPRFVPLDNAKDLNVLSANSDTKALTSNNESKSLGWAPNGLTDTFILFDSTVDPSKSLVLINTIQDNKVTCSVDYLAKGFFEVHCDEPPSTGAEIHYIVFNGKPSTMVTMSSGNLTERVQSIYSAENIMIPRALEQPTNLTSNNNNLTNIDNGTLTQDLPQNNTQMDFLPPANDVASQTNSTLTQDLPQNNTFVSSDTITDNNSN
jgi:hypothetical protein